MDYENINVCRLCLGQVKSHISVFKDDFPKMIKIVTNLDINRTDNLPKIVCLPCAKEVKSAVLLRKRIIRSYKQLMSNSNSVNTSTEHADEEIFIVTDPSEQNEGESEAFANPENYVSDNEDDKEYNSNNSLVEEEGALDFQNTITDISLDSELTNTKNSELSQTVPENISTEELADQQCPFCQKIIPGSKGNFKSHLRTHDGPVNCEFCGETYKYRDSLRQHILYYHKSTPNEIICDICGKGFRRKYTYNLHVKINHKKVKDFECDQCGRKFYTNVHLTRHIKYTHQKLKPFTCDYCNKGFPRKTQLKIHIRQHTKESPFSCHMCQMQFRQRLCLRNHLKSIHKIEEEAKVFCEICKKGFASDNALNTHNAKVHEIEKCGVCSEVFANSEYLINHFREMHAENLDLL